MHSVTCRVVDEWQKREENREERRGNHAPRVLHCIRTKCDIKGIVSLQGMISSLLINCDIKGILSLHGMIISLLINCCSFVT